MGSLAKLQYNQVYELLEGQSVQIYYVLELKLLLCEKRHTIIVQSFHVYLRWCFLTSTREIRDVPVSKLPKNVSGLECVHTEII